MSYGKHDIIRIRRGTASEWTNSIPQPGGEVLKLGEPGYEKDTGKLKIGDGVTPWNSLAYFNDGAAIDPEELQDLLGGGLLTAGSGISIIYNDLSDTLTISTSGVAFLDSPNFTGNPTAPTAASGTNTTQIASTAFVRNEISNLLDSAPSTLDTLNELAAALGDDPNFAVTIASGLAAKAPLVHTHSSSDITNFNSSVSGLIPVKDLTAGTGISISSISGIYTINSTGSGVLSDQAKSLVTTVFNKTGSPIPKMTAVYIDGGQGDLPTVSLAIATTDMTSASTYGLTYEAIPNMQSGQVIVFGALTGLDTDQFNPTAPTGDVNGSIVYLSPSVSGALTLTKPSAPNHIVAIGTVVRTHQNEGVIEVRVQNGFELDELHNVAISGVTNGQFLQYNSGTQLWVPSSSGNFSSLLVNGTGVSVNGHSHLSADISNFNSSVSGLLPITNLISGNYINISSSGTNFTISATGLQPSGNYSLVGHTHSSSEITDFNSAVSGIVSASLSTDILAGASIGLDYSNINDTLTIYNLQESYITSLGSVSGTVPIDYDPKNRSIQTLTLGGTATTLTKGTGWPIWVDFSTDVILKITVSSATTVTWSIVTEWYNQPPAGALSVDTHLILLRAIGNSIIEGHYIGRRTL